ncbi:MAG: hypothetical protein ACREUT_02540 [Steroidobacteraceae bacterium]
MNCEQLKTGWRAGLATPLEVSELQRMSHEVRDCARRYERGALFRRIYGTTAFCLALAVLAVLIVMPGPVVWPGMRVAIALWSASFITCILGLWRVRRAHHLCPDAPLMAYLKGSLDDIHREMAYYRALRWTFWLPFGVGFAFATAWRAPNGGGVSLFLILGASVVWLWGFVYASHHWLKRFEPQAAQLESMLSEIRSDTDTAGES